MKYDRPKHDMEGCAGMIWAVLIVFILWLLFMWGFINWPE